MSDTVWRTLALAFLVCFTAFFIGLIAISLKRGFVSSRGSVWKREGQPILFWVGMAVWLLNASAGALFFFLLLGAR